MVVTFNSNSFKDKQYYFIGNQRHVFMISLRKYYNLVLLSLSNRYDTLAQSHLGI